MLLTQGFLHMLFFIKKKECVLKIYRVIFGFLSIFLGRYLKSLFDIYISYKKYRVFSYKFGIKLLVPSNFFLNTAWLSLYNVFYGFLKLERSGKAGTIVKNNKGFTVLRSPFVNKKSREQLVREVHSLWSSFSVDICYPMIVEYVEFLLKSYVHTTAGLKLLRIKRKG